MGNLLKSSGNQLLKFQTTPTYERYDGFIAVDSLPQEIVSASSLGLSVNSACHGKIFEITNGIEGAAYLCNSDNTFTVQNGGPINHEMVYIHCTVPSVTLSPNYEGKYYLLSNKTWYSQPTIDRLIYTYIPNSITDTQITTAGGNTIDYVFASGASAPNFPIKDACGFAAIFNSNQTITGLYLTSNNTDRTFATTTNGNSDVSTSGVTDIAILYEIRDYESFMSLLVNNYIQICITKSDDYQALSPYGCTNLNDMLTRQNNPIILVATLKYNLRTNKLELVWTTDKHY